LDIILLEKREQLMNCIQSIFFQLIMTLLQNSIYDYLDIKYKFSSRGSHKK